MMMMMMGNDGWMIDGVFGFAVFEYARVFNSNLEKWDTSRVTDMNNSKLSFLYCVVYINIQV